MDCLLAEGSVWMPVFQPASPQAESIRHLFFIVLILSGLIFASVCGLIAIAAYRFRARESRSPEQGFGDRRVEIAWTVGPALVVFWLAIAAAKLVLTINEIPRHQPAAESAVDLVVVGHQWWWEARYPKSGAVAANEIHIPVGTKLHVGVESADVVHSFWVPQLARKIDMIPGRRNHLWLEANEAGRYAGACAEFCGAQHAWMRLEVVADPPDVFAAWEQAQVAKARAPATPKAQAGEKLFLAQTCADCHAIAGTSAEGSAAPDLTHLASRRLLGGGVIENTPENLKKWLRDPASIKPGSKMPDFRLSNAQVEQLTAYLGGLR